MSARRKDRPLSRQLEALGETVVAANQRARESEIGYRRIVAEISRLTDATADAYADNDDCAGREGEQRACGPRVQVVA